MGRRVRVLDASRGAFFDMSLERIPDIPRPIGVTDTNGVVRYLGNLATTLQDHMSQRPEDLSHFASSTHATTHSSGGSDEVSHGNLAGLTDDDHIDYLRGKDIRQYANIATAISDIGATPTTLWITSATTVADNATIPSTTTLRFTKAGSFAIASGKVLTINGSVEADAHQIFSGSGTVAWGDGAVAEIYPQWWGAVGDGATDDTDAIQACFDSMADGMVCRIPSGNYYITSITFDAADECTFYCDGTFTCTTESASGTAFTFGSATEIIRRCTIYGLEVLSTDNEDWTANLEGARFVNIRECEIHIRYIDGFQKNLVCLGTGSQGITHNQFYLGAITNGQKLVYLTTADSGWCNENTFYGGKLWWKAGTVSWTSVMGITIIEATPILNQNRFIGTALESGKPGDDSTTPSISIAGRYNVFMYLRLENMAPPTLEAESYQCLIFYPYGLTDNIVDSGTQNTIMQYYPSVKFPNRVVVHNRNVGQTALTRTMPGFETETLGQNVTDKYGAGLKFMSTDPQFTTENPKFLAGVIPRATEVYDGDTKGGMALDFAVTPDAPGTTNVPAIKMTLTQDGKLGLGLIPTANMAGLSVEDGLLTLKERATPTADTNYGKIYTKDDNKLYFQDGAGSEKEIAFVP